jgi:hypothetical protein
MLIDETVLEMFVDRESASRSFSRPLFRWHGDARASGPTTCWSRRRPALPCDCATGAGPSSTPPSATPASPTSHHTICATPLPRSPSPAGHCEGRPAHARARLGGHDPGRLLRSLRRRPLDLADRMDAAARAAAEARVGAVWAPCGRQPRSRTQRMANVQVNAVGPVGIEPTTRGLKVRCSAN